MQCQPLSLLLIPAQSVSKRANLQLLQTLQELVDAAIQSDAPHHHQLVLAPSWLTGARDNPQEVWLALQTLGEAGTPILWLQCMLHARTHFSSTLRAVLPQVGNANTYEYNLA